MAKQENRYARILGTGAYLPEKVLTNAELEMMVDTSDEWIQTRTGIRERRVAAEEMGTSAMGLRAAQEALANAGVKAEEIDLVLVATATPDTTTPSVACRIQEALGASHAGAFDLSAGCSGFVYGLATASQMIAGGLYEKVLVIGAENLTRFVDWQDRNTCVLFGDGAGAAVLGLSYQPGILAADLGSDGSGAGVLGIYGSQFSGQEHTELAEEKMRIIMDGKEVFKFAVGVVEESALRVLEKCGKSADEISLFIPHQANLRIIKSAAKRMGIGMERVYINVDRLGNTSAASIAIALHEAVQAGKLKTGDIVVLTGFGAGLTWASVVVEW